MSKQSDYSEYKQLSLLPEEKTTYTNVSKKGEPLKIYTKEALIEELKKIRAMGWIPDARRGNVGGVGNTLEDLLGIEENNLPIPNAAEWELKCQRANTTSLIPVCSQSIFTSLWLATSRSWRQIWVG